MADAGHRFRGLLADNDFVAANTYFDTGPTYWSNKGATSRIDFVAVPRTSISRVRSCKVNFGYGLQMINTHKFADHHPIHVGMKLVIRYQAQRGIATS